MTITWCGHACFLLESSCGSVVFDPYAPGKVPGWELPALTADKVVCSHGHADHNWAEGVKLTGRAFSGTGSLIPKAPMRQACGFPAPGITASMIPPFSQTG